MCRSKASGSPRRCKAHAPAARKARYTNRTPEQKARDSAKRRARYLASKAAAPGDATAKTLEFSETIDAAERDAAAYELWLASLTPLQAQLARCGGVMERLDAKWGLTHTREMVFGPEDLDELGVPQPEAKAGRVEAVTVRGRDVTVEWSGKGDMKARSRYVGRVRTWLSGLLDGWAAALRSRDVTDSPSHPARVGGVRQDGRGHDEEGRDE